MTTSIPICFYPLRKLVLDDDQAFSQSILLKLHGKNFLVYDSPLEALDYLIQEYKPSLTKAGLITPDSGMTNSSVKHTIDIHIDKLKEMLVSPPHQDISVLFVDYHMPEMCGLDFLKKIAHLPMKKALITGENDYRIAIDAFNQGLVDAYIRKDEIDFSKKIQNIASELEWKYFIDLSSLISTIPDFAYLNNNSLIPIFKKFIADNDITAFCLTDMQGCFSMLSNDGSKQYFLVRNKMQLQELSIIA